MTLVRCFGCILLCLSRLIKPDSVHPLQELAAYCSRNRDQEAHAGSLSTEEVALLLTSVPDRAAASNLQPLQPAAFARQVSGSFTALQSCDMLSLCMQHCLMKHYTK